jgi:POT family proton-dependent oligopeptide transporter
MSDALAAEPLREARTAHPKGLYVLFATEMWERFSYYGMRALLVLYLLNQLGWQPAESSATFKWYTSLVWLTPLLGGFLADRYLGLRASIITGGVLMAIGHFLMAFPSVPVLFAALGFLIAGNGLFKPNISTLVGRMYVEHDPRRNGAFTIFYMGINVGAAMAPLVCGALRKSLGFHYGFAAAGVGMVIGVLVFLKWQGVVRADVEAAGNTMGVVPRPARRGGRGGAAREKENATPSAGGVAGLLAKASLVLMAVVGVVVPVLSVAAVVRGQSSVVEAVMTTAFALVALAMVFVLRTIGGAARDKSIVIFVLFAFTVLFWMGFEQAGNAITIWADMHTDLHVGRFEYPAEYWQFANAALIIGLAPLFAALWIFLARKGREPSTPAKMFAALVFMVLSFAAMVAAAQAENRRTTSVHLAELPAGASPGELDAGRLRFDPDRHELEVRGVLPHFAVTEALEAVAPPAYRAELARLPSTEAASRDRLLREMAPAQYARALDELAAASNQARVSGMWLFLFYLFGTLGELCLSPVGLSMVTKLAPTRFASLLMGVWFLSNSAAQYVGGRLGESWGKMTPTSYFATFVWTSVVGAILLAALVVPLRRLMHDAAH